MIITRLAIDLAKESFYVCGKNNKNEIVLSKKVSSVKLKKILVDIPNCLVFMEACAGSNYWGSFAEKSGHEVFLISPQHVKPYVTSGQKNDRNDSLAILEASQRPGQYLQKPKPKLCQEIQSILKTREFFVVEKVALTNHIRGLLLEKGITVRKGDIYLKRELSILISSDEGVFDQGFLFIIENLRSHLLRLEEDIERITDQIKRYTGESESIKRLMDVPGVGPISACWFYAKFGDGSGYKNGRQASACVGLVPRQRSTGGRSNLLGITKRGSVNVRTSLIHGARSYVRAVKVKGVINKHTEWIYNLLETKGVNKTAVALANKNARIMWSMLRYGTEFKIS